MHDFINLLRISQPALIFVVDVKSDRLLSVPVRDDRIVGDHRINVVPLRHGSHHRRIFQRVTDAFKMIIEYQFSVPVRHEQAAVDFHHIFRDLDPDTLCIIILLKRPAQFYISQVLMIVELQLLVHGDHFIHIDITESDLRPPHFFLMKCLQDPCLLRSRRHRIIVSLKRHRLRGPADQIQLQHFIEHALVHIHRPGMQFMVRLGFIHLRDLPPGALRLPSSIHKFYFILHDQLKPGPVHVAEAVIPRRERRSRPGKTPRQTLYFLCIHKDRDHLSQIREQGNVIQRQGHLRRRCPDMRQFDQQIIRIHDRVLTSL